MSDELLGLFDADSIGDVAPAAPVAPCLTRIVADSGDRAAWMYARARGITATDVAKLSTPRSIQSAAYEKLNGSSFSGNSWTDHGRAREPVIAEWVLREHGIAPSSSLFHAAEERLHLATPDGIVVRDGGRVELAEIKTTSKAWRTIPRAYLRQVWWQQYVLGAERTLVVWEQHDNFIPIGEQPMSRWVDRDDEQIAALIGLAGQLVHELRDRTARKMEAAAAASARATRAAEARELYGPGALYVP